MYSFYFPVQGGIPRAVWNPLRYSAADPGVGVLPPTGRTLPCTKFLKSKLQ